MQSEIADCAKPVLNKINTICANYIMMIPEPGIKPDSMEAGYYKIWIV